MIVMLVAGVLFIDLLIKIYDTYKTYTLLQEKLLFVSPTERWRNGDYYVESIKT